MTGTTNENTTLRIIVSLHKRCEDDADLKQHLKADVLLDSTKIIISK